MTETDVLERKFSQMDAALIVRDDHRVEGYASVFNIADQSGDVVLPGAYSASLGRLSEAKRRVKMLWQHDPGQPIGVWDEVREDGTGLFVTGRLLPDVAKAREAAALITAGAIDGLSIGYRTAQAERARDGRRMLKELELWEVSLVTFPMLPEARVGGKSDRADDPLERELAAALTAARHQLAAL